MKAAFVESVRNGFVRHPTQKGFTLENWEGAYADCGDNSDPAQKLFDAGKWVFSRLEKSRRALERYDLVHFDKDKALRMFVGYINRTVDVVSKHEWDASYDNLVVAEQMVQHTLDNNELGTPMTPDNILTKAIDGTRFPIVHVSLHGGQKPYLETEEEEDVIGRVKCSAVLGQYYDTIEELWLDFLWHGWEIVDRNDYHLIVPASDKFAFCLAISDYRRQSLLIQETRTIFDLWKHGLPRQVKKRLARQPRVEINGSGESKSYGLHYEEDDTWPPSSLFAQFLAREFYYEDLLEQSLPAPYDFSLRQLLEVWDVLHSLAKEEQGRFPEDSGVFTVQKMLQYAPTISIKDLRALFIKAFECTHEKAQAIVDFLTYVPSPRNELWDAPIVRLSEDKLALVIGPPLYGNLLRIMERFMMRGGVDIGQKGPAFEAHCRQMFEQSIASNNILSGSGVHPEALRLQNSSKEEELDLVLWINTTVLIGEAKCLFFPSRPMEFHHYFETLLEAIRQIKRKTLFVCENRVELLQRIGLEVAPTSIDVKPFVVVNSPFGAGFVFGGVPVADPRILSHFLRQNIFEHFVALTPEGEKQSVGSTTLLYATENEAARNVFSYLSAPPQVALYSKFLDIAYTPIPKLDDKEKPCAVGSYAVRMPLRELKTNDTPATPNKKMDAY